MSILNQPSDGLYPVLIVLVRTLVRYGARNRTELLDACGQGLSQVDGAQLGNTLNRWTELGLFSVQDGVVDLADEYSGQLGRKADSAELRLPAVALAIALDQRNNARFWEAKESKSADFSRGVSWMLAQNIYAIDASTTKSMLDLEAEQIKEEGRRAFQNSTRWNGLQAWMSFFGFSQDLGGLTIDPTDALRGRLGDVFGGEAELPAHTFLERLAAMMPVFDGGAYRVQVEAILDRTRWSPSEEGLLSTSLSRGLQRLAAEGRIGFDRRSDAEGVVTLTGQGGRRWREATHVSILPVRKGA